MLQDKNRGGRLEMIITALLQSQIRIIALAATIGNREKLASWLHAKDYINLNREVELRKGIMFNGKFHWREHNSGQEGEEQILDPGDHYTTESMFIDTALKYWENNESTLAFFADKKSVEIFAWRLMERTKSKPALKALEELSKCENTWSKSFLERLLEHGIAIHHADLPPDQREVLENALKQGEIILTCTTSTLAYGVNFPVENVLMDIGKWEEIGDNISKQYQSRNEIEHKSGRCARPGVFGKSNKSFGRAIAFTDSSWNTSTWLKRFFHGDYEPVESVINIHTLPEVIISLCHFSM